MSEPSDFSAGTCDRTARLAGFLRRVPPLQGWAFALLAAIMAPPALAADKISLQLRWDHQFQFAGYYAAQWMGYYRDAGLEVEIRSAIRPDGSKLNVTEEIASGRADFGVSAADILVARDQGQDLVVLASMFQQSPVAFYALRDAGVTAPANLVGRRVGRRRPNDLTDIEFQAMLRAEGVDPDQVITVPLTTGVDQLLTGEVDATSDFTISADWKIAQLGLDVTVLRPSTYGIDFYGDSLFTRGDLVDANPDLVTRFVTASRAGWSYALENPDEIAEQIATRLVRRYPPSEDLMAFNLSQATSVRKLMLHPLVRPGHVNPARWAHMHEALLAAGLVRRPLDLDRLVFDPARTEAQAQARWYNILLGAAAALGALLLLAAAWIWSLRAGVLQATRSLREAEAENQLLAMVARNTDNAVIVAAADGRIEWVNEAYTRITGYSLDEVRGTMSGHFGETPAPPRTRTDADANDPHGASPVTEIRSMTKSGHAYWCSVEVQPVYDTDGALQNLIAIERDITQRKEAERSLQESQQRFRDFADSASDWFWEMDENLRFTSFSEQVYEVVGIPAEGMLGKSRVELPRTDAEDPKWRQHLDDLRNRRPFRDFRYEIEPADGRARILSISGKPLFDEVGRFCGYRGVGSDVTHQVRAAVALERLAMAIDRIDQGFVLFDAEDRLVVANRRYLEVNAEAADHIVEGARFEDILRAVVATGRFPEASGRTEEWIQERLRRHHNPGPPTETLTTNGRWELIHDQRMPDGSTVIVITDITEIKRAEIELERAKEIAEQANNAKAQFLANMSHELRTPLNGILGFSELLRTTAIKLDPNRRLEYANDIYSAGTHLLSLINDLLEFAKIEAGRVVLQDELVDLRGLVMEMLRFCRPQFRAAGVRLRARIGHGQPAVRASRRAIRQMLLNLLSNALKFTPTGGRVLIDATCREDGLRLSVKDTGAGIPPDRLDSIFEPFHHGDDPLVRHKAGAGLGLSIVKALIESHDGTATVESTPGEGTRITLTFPPDRLDWEAEAGEPDGPEWMPEKSAALH